MTPKLLLLHGALGHANQFEKLTSLLSHTLECHTFAFPGHDNAILPPESYRPEYFVASLENAITDLGKESPVYLFGHSMGGYFALLAALRKKVDLAGVVTLGTKLNWSPEIAASENHMLQPDQLEAKVPAFAGRLAMLHGNPGWKSLVSGIAKLLTGLGEANGLAPELAAGIDIPVKLMLGDRDQMAGLPETTAVYKSLPSGSLSVLPSTPHPYEKCNPERIAFELRDFVRI